MKNSQLEATIDRSSSLMVNTDEINDSNNSIDSRNVINIIHQQFQKNQSQHLDLISKIIDRQSFSLEHYQDRKELPIALQNLDRILQLLEKNLAYTNSHHANYLQNQLALLQGSIVTDLPKEVSTTDLSKQTLINAATNNSTPVVSNSTENVAATDLSTPAVQQSAEIDLTTVNNSPKSSAQGLMEIVISSTIDTPMPAVQQQAKIDLAPTTESIKSNGTVQKTELDPVIVSPSDRVVDTAENLKSNGKAQTVEPDPVIVSPSERVIDAADMEEISNTLLKVVSEKTGYPMEMLDLTMDLEADMGIDSIKQVEIISGMHDAYPQIEVDADTLGETLGELRTLAQIVDYIQQVILPTTESLKSNGKAQTAEPDPVIVSPSDRVVDAVNIEEISNTLLKVVSEKTGYPMEMLDLTMDLEADMGIDSIKQVEIISGMHDAYPQIEVDADTLGETLGELRTLAQIVDYIQQVIFPTLAVSAINPSSVDGITRQSVKKNS